jgi:hypothetical protein
VVVYTNSRGNGPPPRGLRQAKVEVNQDERRRRASGYGAGWSAVRVDALHSRRVFSLSPQIGLQRKKKPKQKCNAHCANREKRRQHQHTHLPAGRDIVTVSSV